MSEFIKVTNHGANPIDLRHVGAKELRPTELHFNTNGSVDDKPTFAMVMRHPSGLNVYGQFSFNTLRDCLNELGFEISGKGYLDDLKEAVDLRLQCRHYLMCVEADKITVEDALEELGYGRNGLGS